jgi:type IV pilus assembly protein PilA
MKTELKAKLLQHLTGKKANNEGFTLIELLVVVIIIGILAAIALPSMLNQASKARVAGAENSVGAVNRAQQAYRLESSVYASTPVQLQIAAPQSKGYVYEIVAGTTAKGEITATPTDLKTDPNVRGCAINVSGVTNITIIRGAAPTAGGDAPAATACPTTL